MKMLPLMSPKCSWYIALLCRFCIVYLLLSVLLNWPTLLASLTFLSAIFLIPHSFSTFGLMFVFRFCFIQFFFPVGVPFNYYLICINFLKERIDIIDNSDANDDNLSIKDKYDRVPHMLVSFFHACPS